MYDATLPEETILGRVSNKGVLGFDVWTSFQNRKHRQGQEPIREDVVMENYRIDAKLQPDLRLDVVTRVTARPQQRVSGAMSFELAPEMEVSAVKVDGQPVGNLPPGVHARQPDRQPHQRSVPGDPGATPGARHFP
ncbi:hypothetical protein [Paludibaculum fermentans]|uniref:Uncharacterized protein n=1 Tax=Paludibaculum fermentans TaxID=1473598 RepID=A0A7S7NMG6_PALFE|nr:hypothetical protein [Paludibaculum fermentans]QOY86343.1 hypothetical protein IRI77_26530 [Paludibaculum fermentans]